VSAGTDDDRIRFIAVGRVTRAHGVKGEVAVLPLSQVESRFEAGSRLLVEGLDHTLTVEASRPHRHRLLVRFDEILGRDQAEALQGRYLLVDAEEAPPLPDGEFWPHQLVGCEVVIEGGRSLGHVREVIHTAANDVWVAEGPDGEVLVPALREVVTNVDLGTRRVEVRAVPGLTVP
jgi:16S rRNA processing protein RimM